MSTGLSGSGRGLDELQHSSPPRKDKTNSPTAALRPACMPPAALSATLLYGLCHENPFCRPTHGTCPTIVFLPFGVLAQGGGRKGTREWGEAPSTFVLLCASRSPPGPENCIPLLPTGFPVCPCPTAPLEDLYPLGSVRRRGGTNVVTRPPNHLEEGLLGQAQAQAPYRLILGSFA